MSQVVRMVNIKCQYCGAVAISKRAKNLGIIAIILGVVDIIFSILLFMFIMSLATI